MLRRQQQTKQAKNKTTNKKLKQNNNKKKPCLRGGNSCKAESLAQSNLFRWPVETLYIETCYPAIKKRLESDYQLLELRIKTLREEGNRSDPKILGNDQGGIING